MKRSIKALAVTAPIVTLSGWIILDSPAGLNPSASDRSMRLDTDGVEAGRLRPLPSGPPVYAPGTFNDSVPPAQRVGDMMFEVVPDAPGMQRHPTDPSNHDFAGNAI